MPEDIKKEAIDNETAENKAETISLKKPHTISLKNTKKKLSVKIT